MSEERIKRTDYKLTNCPCCDKELLISAILFSAPRDETKITVEHPKWNVVVKT
jgi:hypothetical protein